MRGRRGFTLVEAGFTVAAVSVALAIGAVGVQPEDKPKPKPAEVQPEAPAVRRDPGLLGSLARARASARQIKDSTQIRGIHQGLVMSAMNNEDQYPLPSVLDKAGATVAGPAGEKDTTSNIMSVMVFQGFFGPELMVSPAETNKNIKIMKDYNYEKPATAAKPEQALWDPSLNADFTGEKPGNTSYGHLMPSKSRMGMWSNTFSAMEPALANRGPRIEALELRMDGTTSPLMPKSSNTYGIHGSKKSWEGNVAFNDNHVNFMTSTSELLTYVDRDKKKQVDNFFYNEPDDAADSNAVLGIYTKSGPGTKFFKGIWD